MDAVQSTIDARLADWAARLDRLENGSAPDAQPDASHLLFVPSATGYALVEGVGREPAVGALIELEGRDGRYAVTRVVGSPLPGDRRRCACLVAI